MNLAHLTGQHPADLLKLNRTDIRDGMLWFTQNKSGKKLRVQIMGEFQILIERILAREHSVMGAMPCCRMETDSALLQGHYARVLIRHAKMLE